jgi:hypothetical protein
MGESFKIQFTFDGVVYEGSAEALNSEDNTYFSVSYFQSETPNVIRKIEVEMEAIEDYDSFAAWVQRENYPEYNENISDDFTEAIGEQIENFLK